MARGKQQHSKKKVSLPVIPGFSNDHSETTRVIVENPDGGGFQYARRAVAGAPLEAMHDRSQITLEQFQAGLKYRRLWDSANIGRNIGIDPSKEYVDSSPQDFAHHEETVQSIQELALAQRRLGMLASMLVDHVCVMGHTVKQTADRVHNHKPPEGTVKSYRAVFQTGLTDLAYHWNILADPIRPRTRQAYQMPVTDEKGSSYPEQPDSAVYHAAPRKKP